MWYIFARMLSIFCKKNCQNFVSKNGQKIVKKFSKNCQKVVKSCQKVVKKLSKLSKISSFLIKGKKVTRPEKNWKKKKKKKKIIGIP
jgi:hypothetical protein